MTTWAAMQKSEWDGVADFWDKEAGELGIWHQEHDIDRVVWRELGRVRGLRVLELQMDARPQVDSEGGLLSLAMILNRTPVSPLGYERPDDVARPDSRR